MRGAFVMQWHRCDQGDHYDWMLEADDALITFRLPVRLDDLPMNQPLPVTRLGDHRRAYLSYEGPVSGGRGDVRIDDRGDYEATGDPADRWVVRLTGARVDMHIDLQRMAGDSYRLTRQS